METPQRARSAWGDAKQAAFTLPQPTGHQLPEPRTRPTWKGRLAVALRQDDQSRAAFRSRVAYRQTVFADLKAAGVDRTAKLLGSTDPVNARRARTFLNASEFTLKRMSDGAFKDGADAVSQAFSAWSRKALEGVATYELPHAGSPAAVAEGVDRAAAGLLIPYERWGGVARVELYRRMEELGVPHGAERLAQALAIQTRLDQLRRGQETVVQRRGQREGTPEGHPHASRRSMAAKPAVLTLTRIREVIEESLAAPRPEGQAVPSPLDAPRPAPVEVDGYVFLQEPPPPDAAERDHDGWWLHTRGALIAFFVGKAEVEEVISTLESSRVDPTQLGRAADLLRSEGRRSDAFSANWQALTSVVRRANQAAHGQYARLAHTGDDVPAAQVKAFARAALGDHFQRQLTQVDDLPYRNVVAANLYKCIDELLASGRSSIPQSELIQALNEALASRRPEVAAQASEVPLDPPPESGVSVDRDSKVSAASRNKMDQPELQSCAGEPTQAQASKPIETSPASPVSSPGKRETVRRAPKAVRLLLKEIDPIIDGYHRAPPQGRSGLLAQARSKLNAASTQLEAAAARSISATPDKVPYWATGGRKAIANMQARIDALADPQ